MMTRARYFSHLYTPDTITMLADFVFCCAMTVWHKNTKLGVSLSLII